MRKLSFAVFFAVLTFTTFATADDWSKTYDLTGKPDLRVEASDAHVRIETWDQNKIEAHVTTRGWHIGGGDLEIVEHQQGNAVALELRHHHRTHVSFGIDNRRTDLEIRVPRSAKVNVRSGDGSIVARGLEGELEFASVDGRVDLEDLDGSLRAKTSDGSMRASGRFDVLQLHTSDGRIEVEARPGSQLLEAWDVRTSDGSVALRVPGGLAADVELHTSDGHITTNIPIVVEGSFNISNDVGRVKGLGVVGSMVSNTRLASGCLSLDLI